MCDVSYSPEQYQTALEDHAAAKKGKDALVELDWWFRGELRTALQARTPKYITKEELISVVKWKLTRGTWRPKLVKYAEEHSDGKVKDVTTVAFKFVDRGDIQNAMRTLMELKGVGAATSSAVLSAADSNLPFMSDELLLVVNGSKQYTLIAYMGLLDNIRTTLPTGMGVEEYECALWTRAHARLGTHQTVDKDKTNVTASLPRGRKRKR